MNTKSINEPIYSIEIKIKTQRYYNPEKCYGIYTGYLLKSNVPIELKPIKRKETSYYNTFENTNNDDNLMVIKGTTHQLILDNVYTIECYEEENPEWGQQFVISNIKVDIPTTDKDEQEFLKALVTENQYRNVIAVYTNPITKLLDDTFDYKAIKSFSYRSYIALKNKVDNNLVCMSIKSALSEYNLSLSQIKQLLKSYTPEIAIQKVKSNPYILFEEVKGIGFKTCDDIALSSGIKYDDPRRITAALQYIIMENENRKSHCYSNITDVLTKLKNEFRVPTDNIDDYLSNEKLFYKDENRIARRSVYNCELAIAKELKRIFSYQNKFFTSEEIKRFISSIENRLGISYDDKQKELFYFSNEYNVIVFTGSAGTGKTTTLNGALSMYESLNLKFKLLAPTARAAKQMTKSTNKSASTIHRALHIKSDDDGDNIPTLFEDIIVIDEAGMCDIFIFLKLLKSIRAGSKLFIVGDYAQLESVAIGNVLFDIMNSNCIPVVKLDKVFRQALDSGTLDVATRVRYGQNIIYGNQEAITYGVKGDCNIWLGTKESAADRVMTIYKDCIDNGISTEDIMILSPTKKSKSGVYNLNALVQVYINPYSENKNEISVTRDGRTFIFRENDKVMHIKNDYNAIWLDINYEPIIDESVDNEEETAYKKGVFNGEIGKIIQIDPTSKEVYVDYGEFIIMYEDTSYLELAYASTIHKAQGGSAPIVIISITYEHFTNLKRSSLYTGLTRTSEISYIIAEPSALEYAIRNDATVKKQTFLCEMIQNEFQSQDNNSNITIEEGV